MKRIHILILIAFILLLILFITRLDLINRIKSIENQTFYKRLTHKPTVTVLISSYNMANTLPRAINSIVRQTYTDWEILVINDGSLDNTKAILKKYKNNYKIRIVHNRKNIGLIRSLNKGLKLAKGKYIARMDADDISLPNRLERQVILMDKENLDFLAQTHHYKSYTKNEKEDNFDTYALGIQLFTRVYFTHCSVMMRKSFLTKHHLQYNLKYPNAEDYDLWLAIFYSGGKMGEIGGQPISIYVPSRHSKEYYKIHINSKNALRTHYLSKVIPNFDSKMLKLPLCGLLPIIINGNKTTKVLSQKDLEKQYKLNCLRQTF